MTDAQMNLVCKIVGIDASNTDDIEIINLLFGMVESAVCLKIGEHYVPYQLEWIVNECVIKRFQLMGAEHVVQETIDVLSSTYRNPSNLLDEYETYFSDYLSLYGDEDTKQNFSKNKCRLL